MKNLNNIADYQQVKIEGMSGFIVLDNQRVELYNVRKVSDNRYEAQVGKTVTDGHRHDKQPSSDEYLYPGESIRFTYKES